MMNKGQPNEMKLLIEQKEDHEIDIVPPEFLPKPHAEATNVCITEIYSASASEEWLEIYNPRSSPVNLSGWNLTNFETTNVELGVLIGGDMTINASQVITIGDAGAIPTPNYTISPFTLYAGNDEICIIDNNGSYHDVVFYQSSGTDHIDIPLDQGYWQSTSYAPEPGTGETIERVNLTFGGELEDNNLPSDWERDSVMTPGWLPKYQPKVAGLGDILISEVMYGENDNEWVEIVNNGSEDVVIGGCSIYSYVDDNETIIPAEIILAPSKTYIIGEPSSFVDLERNISLNDAGDVLIFNSSSGNILDVVSWGAGAPSYVYGAENGWINAINATGGLSEGASIFRYNLSRNQLSDINSSSDWYTTIAPTPGSFYEITIGDILFSEIHMRGDEFVELYNNFTWPITLDGMVIWDYGYSGGTGTDEVTFNGNYIIPPKGAFTVGDSGGGFNHTVSISLVDGEEDLVLYRADGYELDVVIYGNDISNTYPWGAGTGWIGPDNVSVSGIQLTESIHRINASNFELQDTNTSSDWKIDISSPGVLQEYDPPGPPGTPGSILITEIMVDPDTPETGAEYIEIYNTLDTPVDIGNWSIQRSKYWLSPEVLLPLGTILPPKTYFTFLDDYSVCTSRYSIIGLNYSESFTLDNDPADISLVDSYLNIIDRVAWRTSTKDYVNTLDNVSWIEDDSGVYKGSEGKVLARLYDPYNNDSYIDTNSSADWRYNVYPSVGRHTNSVFFLSTPFSGNATITAFNSPDNSYKAITELIDAAQSNIDMCVYQFTSYYLLQTLIDAMDRGVKVRLILEDIYPLYDSPYLDDSTHGDENFEVVYVAQQVNDHTNGSVRWESDEYFTYTHAKYFIVDNETIVISTENFKPTGIPKSTSAGNRGWGIAIKNQELAQMYLNVFNFDWELGQPFNENEVIAGQRNTLVLSGNYEAITDHKTYVNISVKLQTVFGPDETINVVVALIDNANSSIYAEIFYLYPTWNGYPGGENNNPFLEAIIRAAQRGVDVRVILDSTYYNIEGDNNNDEAAKIMLAHGIKVKYSNNSEGIAKFHVKALIVDEKAVMISSLNWNENSATNNREIGIIVISTTVASYYVELFEYDWDFLASSEIPEDLGAQLKKTYTWLAWLPIITIAYISILLMGYVIRQKKEKTQIKRRFAKDRIKEIEEFDEEEEELMELFPIELNSIRNRINLIYGEKAKVSHLNSEGVALDDIEPSQFVQYYIINNHELIEMGEFLNPIPRVFLLKYTPENYIAIDSEEQDLRPGLFDEYLKSRVAELQDEMSQKNLEIKENMEKIQTLGERIAQLEEVIPDKKGKKGFDPKLALELEEKEKQINELKNLMENLSAEKTTLQEELDKLRESPLDELVSELQLKINKQRLVITRLKQEKGDNDQLDINLRNKKQMRFRRS